MQLKAITTLTLVAALLAVLPAAGATSFEFVDSVANLVPSGESTLVELNNGRTVLCGPDGLMGRLCPLLPVGDPLAFRGALPAADEDAGAQGVFDADELELFVVDLLSDELGDTWTLEGCVAGSTPDGSSTVVSLESSAPTGVAVTATCGPSGSLGEICPLLVVGDCGFFAGRFTHPDEDQFPLLVLDNLVADATVPETGDGGGDQEDGDDTSSPTEPTEDPCSEPHDPEIDLCAVCGLGCDTGR